VTHCGKVLLLTAAMALSACQSAGKTSTQAAASVDPETDQCRASQYQNFIGQPLTAIGSQKFAGPVRAIPWNGAVTMDFNLHRLNFMGDKEGNITRVYCG